MGERRAASGVLALVGLRGSGKTTLGRTCARRLAVPFVDLDAVLESLGPTLVRLGGPPAGPQPVGQLLERLGPELFRWLESRALGGLLVGPADQERPDAAPDRRALAGWDESRARIAILRRSLAPPCVLATGGGVVERGANRRMLEERAHVVWLDAPTPVLRARLERDPTERPALEGRSAISEIEAVRARREPWYVDVADAVLHTDGEPADLARRLADLWVELSAT